MEDENIGADWASFMNYLADQVAFAGGSHWGEKDESRNWLNLCSPFLEEVRYMRSALLLFMVALILLVACNKTPVPTSSTGATLSLTSSAFTSGQQIPSRYTCDGQDISPPLAWDTPPQGTQSFALIVDDPDAPVGTWVHWVAYDIPASARNLPEAIPAQAKLPGGGMQGKNSWPNLGYGGPCPPSGTHRYYFRLYALDTTLNLDSGATKKEVLKAMEDHVLAVGELMGQYSQGGSEDDASSSAQRHQGNSDEEKGSGKGKRGN